MPYVDASDSRIWYEDQGAGAAVVLGHSFLCSGAMWREQVPALAAGHRVLNVDFRGHGRSGQVTRPFSLNDAVADVVDVLDDAGIEKAVWCGLSIGGMVALRAALERPERVAGLVLMDSHAGAERLHAKIKYRAMGLGARLLGVGPFQTPIARLMFGASTFRDQPALVREWKGEFASVHIPSILEVLETLVRRDSVVDRLSEIEVPALVVVGTEDRSLPPALSRRIHEGLLDSELVEIPRAGHLSALEQPEAVNAALVDFLARRIDGQVP